MLNGIKIFSSDDLWRHILRDMGADVVDAPAADCVNFDDIAPNKVLSPYELKGLIFGRMDNAKILHSVFGENVPQMSDMQASVVVQLARSDGLSGAELKKALDYMPVATHAIDTAIYNLRKLCGRDFIVLENGVYKIGTV